MDYFSIILYSQQLVNTIGALFNANIERENMSLDSQLEKLQENYDERLATVDQFERDGIYSAEQADAERAYIAEEQKKREDEIEQRRKEIAIRQAKYEKAQALAGVAIATSVAIAKALPNLVLAGIVAATGAAQAIAIAATPLPEYRKGTLDHPGGGAIVGDGGKPEMIIYPSGQIAKTPSVSTLVDLPAHTQVLPDFNEAIQMFTAGMLNRVTDGTNIVVIKNEKELEVMKSSLRQVQHVSNLIYEGNKMTFMLNNNIQKLNSNNSVLIKKKN